MLRQLGSLSQPSSGLLHLHSPEIHPPEVSSCFVRGTSPSCRYIWHRTHTPSLSTLHKLSYLHKLINQTFLSTSISETREESDNTDPLRMCYVQRTSIWLFCRVTQSTADRITSQLGFKYVSALSLFNVTTLAQWTTFKKHQTISLFSTLGVKTGQKRYFRLCFSSALGTNSFSVLCTHLIDFNVAVRLRYECFPATYASCVLINCKCFPPTAELSNSKRTPPRDWEKCNAKNRESQKKTENGL